MFAEISPGEDPQVAARVLIDNVERTLKVGKCSPKEEAIKESNDENTDYF